MCPLKSYQQNWVTFMEQVLMNHTNICQFHVNPQMLRKIHCIPFDLGKFISHNKKIILYVLVNGSSLRFDAHKINY